MSKHEKVIYMNIRDDACVKRYIRNLFAWVGRNL